MTTPFRLLPLWQLTATATAGAAHIALDRRVERCPILSLAPSPPGAR